MCFFSLFSMSYMLLVRPERFELPTTWFEARCSREEIAVLSVSYGHSIVLLNAELRPNKYLIPLNAICINSTRNCTCRILTYLNAFENRR